MLSDSLYFLLGAPCAGKSTVSALLARAYGLHVFSGDAHRMDFYRLADKEKHPCMTARIPDFFALPLEDMIAWERGVIREQTPMILRELQALAQARGRVLFEGMLDTELLIQAGVAPHRALCLTVARATQEREFFARDDHARMRADIMNAQGIDEAEKRRRLALRRQAALDAFARVADTSGLHTLPRAHRTAEETAARVAQWFELS